MHRGREGIRYVEFKPIVKNHFSARWYSILNLKNWIITQGEVPLNFSWRGERSKLALASPDFCYALMGFFQPDVKRVGVLRVDFVNFLSCSIINQILKTQNALDRICRRTSGII